MWGPVVIEGREFERVYFLLGRRDLFVLSGIVPYEEDGCLGEALFRLSLSGNGRPGPAVAVENPGSQCQQI